jgi:diguanylate cyclase (GGDEF)-like protein
MQQVLAIALRTEWPRAWELRGYEVRFLGQLRRSDLTADVAAVVVIAEAPARIRAAAEVLDEARRDISVPLLLAGRADTAELAPLLHSVSFDGFLDLSWPPALAASCLELAARNVDSGKNLVEIQRAILEQSRAETQVLYEQANQDPLTHLFNHRHFSELMAREHERNKRAGHPYALVYIDLDNLKTLNTRYGHEGGSDALRTLAQVMTESLRASDVALRVGGDEFVVYLPDCDKQAGASFAERVRQKLLARPFVLHSEPVQLSFSAGVASFPEDAIAFDELLDRADQALLEAKRQGKNRAVAWVSGVESAGVGS